jgi:hypothetical protein
MKLYVVARNRSALVDGNMTLKEVAVYLDSIGHILSLRRTLQLYGLHYAGINGFTKRYGGFFELSSKKTMWNIKIKELEKYKQSLFFSPFNVRR